MTSGSLIAWSAFAASFSAVHWPAAAVGVSRSSYLMVKFPTLEPASSIAMTMPLTMVSVWPRAEPVRGRLETILMTGSPCSPRATSRGPKAKEPNRNRNAARNRKRGALISSSSTIGGGQSRRPPCSSQIKATGSNTTRAPSVQQLDEFETAVPRDVERAFPEGRPALGVEVRQAGGGAAQLRQVDGVRAVDRFEGGFHGVVPRGDV